MGKTEQELRQELNATTREIARLVARSYGYDDPDSLDPRRRLEDVDAIIEDYEHALRNGSDNRFTGTVIGLLLQRRHELERQILDLCKNGALLPKGRPGRRV